jgi:hypothetical protein
MDSYGKHSVQKSGVSIEIPPSGSGPSLLKSASQITVFITELDVVSLQIDGKSDLNALKTPQIFKNQELIANHLLKRIEILLGKDEIKKFDDFKFIIFVPPFLTLRHQTWSRVRTR